MFIRFDNIFTLNKSYAFSDNVNRLSRKSNYRFKYSSNNMLVRLLTNCRLSGFKFEYSSALIIISNVFYFSAAEYY